MLTNSRTEISMLSKRSDDYKKVMHTLCLLWHMLRLHHYPSSLLYFPPSRHLLELVLLLSAIQGKQSPAELICFLHQWFATSPLAFSLRGWKTLMVSRAGSRAASPTSTQGSTHTDRNSQASHTFPIELPEQAALIICAHIKTGFPE